MATGFSFGGLTKTATTSANTTGFTLGAGAAGATGAGTAPAGGGFSFGGGLKTNTTTSSGGFSLGGLGGTTTTASTGLTLGATTTAGPVLGGFGGLKLPATSAATTATTGFSLAPPTTTSSTGLNLGATSTGSTGLFGGGLGATATTKPTLTLGGLNTTTSAAAPALGGIAPAAGGNIFTATATTASRGLGGVDPKTASSTAGSTSTTGKSSDSKAIKETALPTDICQGVENFKKHLKSQKSEREEIARVSQKALTKVQEDVSSLRQLLAVVSNGLQRNTVAVNKLKAESAQELKYSEVAQRTKDTPPGLQYENTAPMEYFHRLVEDFEGRMLTYRQQIEELESHLASLSKPVVLTPQELSVLFHKVHDSFVALAAQLQLVHESVKVQKEHYLNCRKVFHGETTDIFEKRRKAVEKLTMKTVLVTTVGPTPFTELPNATALAMASAINRTNPPAVAPALGAQSSLLAPPPTTNSSIFGAPTATPAAGFGTGGFGGGTAFGGAAKTQTVTPFNLSGTSSSIGGSSLFGAGDQQKPTGITFGTPATATGIALGSTTNTPVAGEENKTFQLQRPPQGNKRGKRN